MKTNALGKAVIGCRVYTNTAINLSNNIDTVITFTNEEWDTDSCWTLANNSLVYARTAGTYLVGIAAIFASNSLGNRVLSFSVQDAAANDVTGTRQAGMISAPAPSLPTYLAFSTPVVMGKDYALTLRARQNSGMTLALNSAEIWLFQIG